MNSIDVDTALIAAVQKRGLLYNTRHVDFKNIQKKERVWQTVGEEVGITGGQARRRWTVIRDNFLKYHRRKKAEEKDGRPPSPAQYLSQYQGMMWYLDFATSKPHRTWVKILPKPSDSTVHFNLLDESMTLGGTEEIYAQEPSCTSSGQFTMPVETQMAASEEEEEVQVTTCEQKQSVSSKPSTTKDVPSRRLHSFSAGSDSRRRGEMDDLMVRCMKTITQAVQIEEAQEVDSKMGCFLNYLEQLMKTVKPELQDELQRDILDIVFSFKKKYPSGS